MQLESAIIKDKKLNWIEYLEKVSELNEKYELLEQIGEGAFAVVFIVKLKKYPEIKERFAMKFTIPIVNPSRIANEIHILKKLGGENNVVKLHHAFRIEDKTFMIMDYIEHKKFGEFFTSMETAELVEYFRNLLTALHHIHCSRIIHRDVKPDNFLYDRKRKRYALVDFGLSHSETRGDLGDWFANDSGCDDSAVTVYESDCSNFLPVRRANSGPVDGSGQPCVCGDRGTTCSTCRARPPTPGRRGGTLGYRAPEVMLGCESQTTGVDVWAVGVMLACCLSARYPLMRGVSDTHILLGFVRLLSHERMKKAAERMGRRLVVGTKVKSLHDNTVVTYLRDRLAYMRRYSDRLLVGNGGHSSEFVFEPEVYALLSRLLEPNPAKRVSCEQALTLPIFCA